MIYSVVIFCLFIGSQTAMYWKDNGIYVADSYDATLMSEQFHVLFKPISERELDWFEKWAYWRALKKFPTSETCLKDTSEGAFNINAFNWKSIRNEAQMQVCLHHVVVELRDLKKVRNWLESTGFDAHILFSGEGPRMNLSAIWSTKNNSQSHPFSFYSMWGLGQVLTVIIPLPYVFDINMSINKEPTYLLYSTTRFRTNF